MSTGSVVRIDGNLFPGVEGIPSSGGVAMNPPSPALLGSVTDMIANAMKHIPEGERGKLVAVVHRDPVTGKVSTNAAFAVKAHEHVNVVAWFGKTWGQPISAGVMTEIHF